MSGYGDFDGATFAMGTVRGMRAFNVTYSGQLTSPVREEFVWKPGENKADCYICEHMYSTPRRPGGRHCSCGFYAYYDGSNEYMRGMRVAGIVEGYGKITYGPKGFRAEKAEIVALIQHGKATGLPAPAKSAMVFLGLWWTYWVVMICFYIKDDDPWGWGSGLAILTILTGLGLAMTGRLGGWFYGRKLKRAADYYKVPLYRTQRQALKHHPLTEPAALP